MPVVFIPSLLRDLTGGVEKLTVNGDTLRQVIDQLEVRYPGIRARLCNADRLRPDIAAAVEGKIIQQGLGQPLSENSEIHFVPALSGGQQEELTPL